MNRSNVFFALVGVGLSMFFQSLSFAETLLIENVTLVSPELPQPLGNRNVLVRDGRIAAVSEKPITAPAGARRLDGTGKYLTPGITDAHVHVSQAIGLPMGTSDPAIAAVEKSFFAQQPRSYLYFGVTQLLDPSNWPERVAEFGSDTQMKRAAQPEELSPAFVFLASPVCSGYITGIVLPVTGSVGAI